MNVRTSPQGHVSSPGAALPAQIQQALLTQNDGCAHCGALLMKAAASEICSHCHFVYCSGHRGRDQHHCEEVCLECPPSWGA